MASEVHEAALEISGAINHLSDLVEGDVFPERIAVALEGIERQLGIANQLKAHELAMSGTSLPDLREIIAGKDII